MSQERIQRWTDVALKREGGTEITKGAARLYSALLVRETEGLLKLVLTRPARVTVPGETDASARVALALGGAISVDGRDVSVGDSILSWKAGSMSAAALQFATSAEAEAFASAAGEPTPAASLESLDLNRPEVQRYVAELLVDPAFEKFVGDLGEYYDRLKKTLPADAAGAAPFVRGRGGTASKRTDPMDDD